MKQYIPPLLVMISIVTVYFIKILLHIHLIDMNYTQLFFISKANQEEIVI